LKQRNEPIGEVECPRKGCNAIAKVYRFRPRGAPERKTVFSNKLYGDCPSHGRFGADGNQATHDYIMEHATWDPNKGPGPATAVSEKKPDRPAAASSPRTKQVQAPEQAPAPTKGNGAKWRTLIDLED
jgi:hypothetical protein